MRIPQSILDFAWISVKDPRRHWQRLTALWRTLPDFFIIGASRSGTTSLYRYLIECPQIRWAYKKEVGYFSKAVLYMRGLHWYQHFFPARAYVSTQKILGRRILVGEGTPYYLFHPLVPGRMAALLPAAKMIALLRNPIDRAYSQYQQSLQAGHERLTFEKAVAGEEERLRGEEERLTANGNEDSPAHKYFSYLSRGRYAEQLQRWFRFYSPESFLTLKSEDLYERPRETMARVLTFLDLPADSPVKMYPQYHAGKYTDMDPHQRRRLAEYFGPYNQRLYDLIGENYAWEASE